MTIPTSYAEYIAARKSVKDERWGREIARINYEVADGIARHLQIGDGDRRRDIIRKVWELGREIFKSKIKDFVELRTDFADTANEVTFAIFIPDSYRSKLAGAANEHFGIV